MSTIALTVTATTVTTADGRATLTASVTNSATVPARIVLGAFGPAGAATAAGGTAWTDIERPLREIGPGATEQYTITFAPGTEVGAGTYPVRFIAYSADQAPEEHADQAKQVDVVVPATTTPVKPPFVWWPWAVAAALVLVAGVVGFIVLRPNGPPVPTPVPTPTSASPTPSPCADPWVPRLTRPEDLTCVTPASAAEVIFDNNPAVQQERKQPDSIYCKPGWVWRVAYPEDLVCVTVQTRTRTAEENKPDYTNPPTPTLMPTWKYPTIFLPPTIIATFKQP